MVHLAAALGGAILIVAILWDGFETVILPRRVTRKFRPTRAFYRYSWLAWSGVFRRAGNRRRREQALSAYGPLSMLVLLTLWAAALMVGFALVHWGRQSPVAAPEK